MISYPKSVEILPLNMSISASRVTSRKTNLNGHSQLLHLNLASMNYLPVLGDSEHKWLKNMNSYKLMLLISK